MWSTSIITATVSIRHEKNGFQSNAGLSTVVASGKRMFGFTNVAWCSGAARLGVVSLCALPIATDARFAGDVALRGQRGLLV